MSECSSSTCNDILVKKIKEVDFGAKLVYEDILQLTWNAGI